MKSQRLLLAAVAIALATTAQAQVKVGANPGTISTNAVLDVEGTSGSRSVILQNGNMGVGTATPGAKLEILGTGSSLFDAGIILNNTATNGRKWSVGSRTDITSGTGSNGTFIIADESAGLPRLIINQSGSVGINLSTPYVPGATLEVNGTAKIDNLPAGSTSDNVVTTDANGNLRKLATPLFNELIKGQMVLPPSGAADFTNHSVTTYDSADFLLISKATTASSTNVPASEICVYEYRGTALASLTGVYTLLSAFNNSSYPDTFVGNSEGVANVGGKTRITIKWVRVDNLVAGWGGTFGGTVFIAR